MYRIVVSEDKTLIVIIFSGKISSEQLVQLYKEIKEHVKLLKKSFNVLFDFSKIQRIDSHGYAILEGLEPIKEYAANNGMHKSAIKVSVEVMAEIILRHSDLLEGIYANAEEIKEFFNT
ncbi:MAG: hypothetical protein Q8936_08370 [Bacillota bacterium]|nr:hypothetical protein [Bacillota bacterium]